MHAIVRTKPTGIKVIIGEDFQDCVKKAYEDYKEQMNLHYEDGAYTPCDNLNKTITEEQFKEAIISNKQAGHIVAINGTTDISFNYKYTDEIEQAKGIENDLMPIFENER